ncbi:Fe-S protein assembly co-chaperone HscB [Neisseriaceae bacterium TC5R-5]|nr:Fe-S protein assembly co-chaperone HscB [Neisseriaceae bacterium TC5R-5]
MTYHFEQDFFQLFNLPRCFALDKVALEQAWKATAAQVHPDRYVSHSDAEQRLALMRATQLNEAYRTLKTPLNRARYLLKLAGIDTGEDSNTSMPGDFLMAQMQWREDIEAAQRGRQLEELYQLAEQLQQETLALQTELGQALDQHNNLDSATLLVRKLRFLEKLDQEIGDSIEMLLE